MNRRQFSFRAIATVVAAALPAQKLLAWSGASLKWKEGFADYDQVYWREVKIAFPDGRETARGVRWRPRPGDGFSIEHARKELTPAIQEHMKQELLAWAEQQI